MRTLGIGSKNYTKVIALDERSDGNANHKYEVQIVDEKITGYNVTEVNFQNGAIKENGVNGCHNEDLIAIVIDRLQGFQSGDFACRENEIAITKLEESLMWLRKRTQDRIDRGVEGRSIK